MWLKHIHANIYIYKSFHKIMWTVKKKKKTVRAPVCSLRTPQVKALRPDTPVVPPSVSVGITVCLLCLHGKKCVQFSKRPFSFSAAPRLCHYLQSFVQGDGDIRRGDVAFLPVVPADAGPAVAFVLLHHGQNLAFLHWDGAFAGPWVGQRREHSSTAALQGYGFNPVPQQRSCVDRIFLH